MTRFRISLSIGATALGLLLAAQLFSAPAKAQTWVSSVTGSDTSGCGFPAAPCRTLQYAVNLFPNNNVKCLDAVNEYTALAISWPITIDCTGAPGLIYSHLSVIAVQVNISEATYPNGVVTLRGLTIISHPGALPFIAPGVDGIRVIGGGGAVHVENSTIQGFGEQGIDFAPSSSVDLFVRDTIIRNNAGGGVWVVPAAAATVRASLSNVRLDRNGTIALAVNKASGGTAAITVENTLIEKNSIGLRANGANAFMLLIGSTVTYNTIGLQSLSGGKIQSFGNNAIHLNNTNGAPTSTVLLK